MVEVAVLLDELNPNDDPVDGAVLPKEVEVEVVGVDPDPKLNAGVEVGASVEGVAAGLPNENPPNGLDFAAAGAGVAVGAGAEDAPNEKPADAVVDGAADEDCPKENEPNGDDVDGVAAGAGAYEISMCFHRSHSNTKRQAVLAKVI